MNNGISILLVDGDEASLKGMQARLRAEGVRVRTAGTASAALRSFKRKPALPIIRLDLPDGPGEDLIRELRKASPEVSCIIRAEAGNLERAVTAAADNDRISFEDRADDLRLTVRHIREIADRILKDQQQQNLMHDLRERVKELNCLYSISKVIEKNHRSIDRILAGIVALIPPAWQYPEITCARLTLDETEFQTDGFKRTKWRQSSNIFVAGQKRGSLDVYYLEDMPEFEEGPFLKEERALIESITERIGIVVEQKESEKELRQREEQLSSLSQKALTVLEEERERVARELHDSIGQQLAAMRLEILWLKDQLPEQGNPNMFKSLINITLNASEELKHICMGLHPPILDKLGFNAALNELIREFGANRDMRIAYEIDSFEESLLKPPVSINIYRILQEALTNIARHSKAHNVKIAFKRKRSSFLLKIEDDGMGMDQARVAKSQGFGIMGMKERANIIGGSISFRSKPGRGAKIRLIVPVKES